MKHGQRQPAGTAILASLLSSSPSSTTGRIPSGAIRKPKKSPAPRTPSPAALRRKAEHAAAYEAWVQQVDEALRQEWGYRLEQLPKKNLRGMCLPSKFRQGRDPLDVIQQLTPEDMGFFEGV